MSTAFEANGRADSHTPGPWTTSSRKGRVIVIDADRNEVCEAHAAAALIAAAPDLLQALTRVLDDLLYFSSRLVGPELTQRLTSVEEARAAITKATGEQQ